MQHTRPLLIALLLAQNALAQNAPSKPLKEGGPGPLDVLVIAPHPDDEVIGCAGIMLQALQQNKRVAVVVITSGDGYPALAAVVAKKNREQLAADDFLRAGALRQQHSVRAMARIGVPKGELMFLGYPDSGLEKIYTLDGSEPFRQMFTNKNATYGVTVPDYHSSVHGRPAPYLKANVVGDIAQIIRDRQPKEIYVTHEADTHGDHRAAFWFVRDAARSANYQGDFFTYVVHGAPPSHPPSRRVTLTPAEVETKRAALQDHQAGTSPIHDKLADEYTKPQELFWQIPVILSADAMTIGQDRAVPWITSKQRLTILSANDGRMHLRSDPNVKTVTQDSITVIHLGPDQPPMVKTVYGAVPNTISGAPYMAMTGDGRYGFVTSRKIAEEPDAPDIVSVIDLASPDLKVVQTVKLPNPRMAVMHPDGKRLLIPYDTGIRVFEMRAEQLELVKDNPTAFRLQGIDISPRGDRVVGNGTRDGGKLAAHVLSYRDGAITYEHEVKIKPGLTDWDGPYACRFTTDGARIIIPNGRHIGSKGTLAPVFIAPLKLDATEVTEVIPQIADGIEGVAVHPSGKFAVLSCLDDSPRLVHQAYSHLAVIDLSSQPVRLLYHLDVESLPEGMEFSPDGSQLFVGLTYAHRIAVYDVDGFRLKRNPFVIRVGHGPCSMAIGPRFSK